MSAFYELVADYTETCFACPAQYEGTLKDGSRFYFRYRFGWASLQIDDGESAREVSVSHGDDMAGVLGVDEFQVLFVRLYAKLNGCGWSESPCLICGHASCNWCPDCSPQVPDL